MKKENSVLQIIGFVAIILVIVVAVGYLVAPKSKYSTESLIGLAKTLTEKGVVMYGAEWCSHCKAEKARFKSAWQYVTYVECPENQQICMDKGIQGYPTWITAEGDKYEGEQGLEKLAEIAGYQLE